MSKLINNFAILVAFMLVLTPFAFADQLSLKKVSDLKPGDVIVDNSGNQIPVETIKETDYKISTNLIQILTGKLTASPLTGNVIAPITGKVGEDAAVAAAKSSGFQPSSIVKWFGGWFKAKPATPAEAKIAVAPQQAAQLTSTQTTTALSTAQTTAQTTAASLKNAETGVKSAELALQNAKTAQSAIAPSAPGAQSAALDVQKAQTALVEKQTELATAQAANTKALEAVSQATPKAVGEASYMPSTWADGHIFTTTDANGVTTYTTNGAWGYGDMLFTGLQYAAVAYMAVQFLGPMFGLDEKQTSSVSLALATGAGLYGALASQGSAATFGGGFANGGLWAGFSNSYVGFGPAGIAIIAAAAVLLLTYKSTKTETITFSCLPWQAPTSANGGKNCEACNDDTLPCSEYRCKSLGQACELVNPGTGNEKCVWVNPKDVTPPVITPNPDDLPSDKYKYTNVKLSPPGPGFTITNLNKTDGCVPAFTPLTFGITTDEPSQCKIDYNHTTKLDDMAYYFGGSNLYLYNHTEQFSLPGPANLKKENLTIDNGGKWTFYLRCQDKNGNANEAEYALRFCVDPTPDTTAPVVKVTSLENGGCIPSNKTSANVDFYMNEPSTCRWSRLDQSYDNMQGNMTCSNRLEQMNAQQLYTCSAQLDGVARDGTDYYVRCKDSSDNKMAESFKYSLKGSTQLLIKTIQPNETVFGGVSPAPVELFVQTNYGCDSSKSVCFYSQTGNLNDFTMFYDTNKEDGISTQKLFLTGGAKKMYVRCVDSGGNLAEANVNFTVEIDVGSPIVARIYEEDNYLKLVTVRDSECAYTNDDCSFLFEEGTQMPTANTTTHVTEWMKDKTYYIKCRDEYRNSDDASCSVVVQPTQTFF